MLTDVAFQIGQTLTHSVTLPQQTSRIAKKEPSKSWLKGAFGLPMKFYRLVLAEHRAYQLDRELCLLPASVLNDLNLDRHQLLGRHQLPQLNTHHGLMSVQNGYYR